jgi:hypothetical protein
MDGQHLGALRVSGELMRDMLFRPSPPGQWFRVDGGIPADAEFVRCYQDAEWNEFVFVYRHPSFPLVPPGERAPLLDPPRLSALYGVRVERGTGRLVVLDAHPDGVRVAKTEAEFGVTTYADYIAAKGGALPDDEPDAPFVVSDPA